MLREDLAQVIQKASAPELRKFGLLIGAILIIASGFLFWRHVAAAKYVLLIGGIFGILGIWVPALLRFIYLPWMGFAVVMGFIMSHLILGLIFFLIFTPAGVIVRLLRKDPLEERMDPEAQSYWIPRERKPFDPKSMERQY